MADAIVIGAGPNGLVAANLLADAGWEVLVLEAEAEPGGAARSGEPVEPGFVVDHCSAFYPFVPVGPIGRLRLEEHGLRWRHAPLVLAHPAPDGSCPVLSPDVDETAASLDRLTRGDGAAWYAAWREWERVREPLLGALLDPFPPVRHASRLAWRLRRDTLRFARQMLLPVRLLGEEMFTGDGARRLLAGTALHADYGPETAGGGMFGFLLMLQGQDGGFPVPEGGASAITQALVRRLESRGGEVRCGHPVTRVLVERERAVGVEAHGERFTATRAVVADVDAPRLFRDLVGHDRLPARFVDDLRRFRWDHATIKVDWTLDAPVPWIADDARRAGTVHVSESVDALTRQHAALAQGLVPAAPFLLVGQQSMTDPSRQPAGRETLWAYTHLPQCVRGDERGEIALPLDARGEQRIADRMEDQLETLAPGFRDLVRGRQVLGPATFETSDGNLHRGAVAGGTMQLHQSLVFRPVPGWGRPETPVPGLYLGSASAHPGGGVHGAPGANAARAALLHHRLRRSTLR